MALSFPLTVSLTGGLTIPLSSLFFHGDVGNFLNASNLVANTEGLTETEFQNKLANLGYLSGDEAQFQSDINAGNVILISDYNAASVIYP